MAVNIEPAISQDDGELKEPKGSDNLRGYNEISGRISSDRSSKRIRLRSSRLGRQIAAEGPSTESTDR